MNFSLTEEQEFLQEAARGTLGRVKTVEAARDALEGAELPDLWPARRRGRLARPADHPRPTRAPASSRSTPCSCSPSSGSVLASVPLLGHLPATSCSTARARRRRGAGRRRAARGFVPALPPSGASGWTTEPREGSRARRAGADGGTLTARRLGAGRAGRRRARGRRSTDGASARVRRAAAEVEAVGATTRRARSAHVPVRRRAGHAARAAGAPMPPSLAPGAGAARRRVARRGRDGARGVRRLRQGALHLRPRDRLLPGDEAPARRDPAAARERPLADVLRGLGGPDKPEEFALAASAFRLGAGKALDQASRTQISVHGGIGATFEHDAPLYFRARSCRGGCSAGRRARPTASPTSCSHGARRRRRPAVTPSCARCTSGPTTAGASRSPSTTASRSTSTRCCASACVADGIVGGRGPRGRAGAVGRAGRRARPGPASRASATGALTRARAARPRAAVVGGAGRARPALGRRDGRGRASRARARRRA